MVANQICHVGSWSKRVCVTSIFACAWRGVGKEGCGEGGTDAVSGVVPKTCEEIWCGKQYTCLTWAQEAISNVLMGMYSLPIYEHIRADTRPQRSASASNSKTAQLSPLSFHDLASPQSQLISDVNNRPRRNHMSQAPRRSDISQVGRVEQQQLRHDMQA